MRLTRSGGKQALAKFFIGSRSSGQARKRLPRPRAIPRGDQARPEAPGSDDGVGRDTDSPPKGTGLGTRIVSAMARTIGAEVEYFVRHPGCGALLAFACPAEIG